MDASQADAHSRNKAGHRQPLTAHLRNVADLCSRFAEPLGAADLGRYLGLCHDVGKFDPAFNAYLDLCEREPDRRHRGPDHKAAGTLLASKHAPSLPLLVHGHHGGLRTRSEVDAALEHRRDDPAVSGAIARALAVLSSPPTGDVGLNGGGRSQPARREVRRWSTRTQVEQEGIEPRRPQSAPGPASSAGPTGSRRRERLCYSHAGQPWSKAFTWSSGLAQSMAVVDVPSCTEVTLGVLRPLR